MDGHTFCARRAGTGSRGEGTRAGEHLVIVHVCLYVALRSQHENSSPGNNTRINIWTRCECKNVCLAYLGRGRSRVTCGGGAAKVHGCGYFAGVVLVFRVVSVGMLEISTRMH